MGNTLKTQCQKREWKTYFLPNKTQALVAFLLVLGLALTFWQVQRAQYKLSLLNHPHAEISPDNITKKNHLDTTQLNGQFVSEHLFVQPRSLHHIPGYQVWVPFATEHGNILVSLGFQTKVHIPSLSSIHGTVFFNTSSPFRMAQNSIKPDQIDSSNPAIPSLAYIVGQLDLELFSRTINVQLPPYIVILDDTKDQSVSIPSLDQVFKHVSYAIQFLLLTLLACFYVYRQAKQKTGKES